MLEKVNTRLFKLLFQTLNPGYELIEYTTTKIKFKCKKCAKVFNDSIDNYKNIKPCPNCIRIDKLKLDIATKHPNIDTDFIYGEIRNIKNTMLFKCKKCGHIWKDSIFNLKRSKRDCPICSVSTRKKTMLECLLILSRVHPNLKIIKMDKCDKVTTECKECGHIRTAAFDLILKGSKCEICTHHRYTLDSFKKHLYEINPDLEVIGEYKTLQQPIKVQCKKCKRIWETPAFHLIYDNLQCRCNTESTGEKIVKQILQKYGILFQLEYIIKNNIFTSKNFVKIDFFIESKNVFIEYNGIQHYKPVRFFNLTNDIEEAFKKLVIRDSELRKYCDLHNIKLLEIKYTLNEEEIENLIKETLNII